MAAVAGVGRWVVTGGLGLPGVEQCHGRDCWDRGKPLHCVGLWVLISEGCRGRHVEAATMTPWLLANGMASLHSVNLFTQVRRN